MKLPILVHPILSVTIGFLVVVLSGCNEDDDTRPDNKVMDIDGNVYQTVVIGTQTWMAENLKTTTFNDGTEIPLVVNDVRWSALTSPDYCWYNNDQQTYGNTYGALYNWYAVNTGNLCPAGWHVPGDDEWRILTDYLGGEEEAADKLKKTGSIHWASLNSTATNETGFTALPNGLQFPFEYTFSDNGFAANWWSRDILEQDKRFAWYRELGNRIKRDGFLKEFGIGVRCIRD
jgi:uncharacterized protein (TIGR02145 family)